MKHTAIIWDLDGTLLDSLQDLHDAVNHALTAHGCQPRTIAEVRAFVGNGVRHLVERALFSPYPDGTHNAAVSDTQFEAIFAEFKRWYIAHCRDHTAPYPGIIDTLRTLRGRGVKMAIVSNKLQAGVTELHTRWFADLIDIAVGERAGIPRKPDPAMIGIALQELKQATSVNDFDEVWYIGDSEVDIQTARQAALPCISALWGFRTREQLTAAGATHFAQQPEEIICDIEHKQEKD